MFTFFDLETTDKYPVSAEILTGYFFSTDENFKKIDECYIESQVDNYKIDSFEIHGISKAQAMKFPPKREALRKMISYMLKHKNNFFVCHANGDIMGKKGYFDWQVIMMQMHFLSDDAYWFFLKNFSQTKVISTHTIAKKTLKLQNYKLNTIAKYFNIELNHHEAKSDTIATAKIFEKLLNHYKKLSNNELYNLAHWSGDIDFNKKIGRMI